MAKVTISQLLGIQQTVKSRLNDLIHLRDTNASVKETRCGANADKPIISWPTYNMIGLEKIIGKLYREQRRIDEALKNANATTTVPNYEWNDEVLGEVEQSEAIFTPPAAS